ncbi:hypothetical protein JT31_01785 [Cedecea neteri]|uniref:Phage tail assembly protein n=1 Tax=Cedecea neteri TaxID=158822 RepID=A0A089PSW2_9ENTR|nr:phage tail assembly protein [Cedecea neteri]AIR03397.1 hypothetical protein JT31_01785 [Cedecea neteri]
MSFPDNKIEITLDFPYTTLAGVEIEKIVMRSPTVRDRLLRKKDKRDDMEADIHMIANMCGLESEDLMNMEGCDYLRLERQFNVFLTPVIARKKAKS